MKSLLRRSDRRTAMDALKHASDELDDLSAAGSRRAQLARETAREWWERGARSARDAADTMRSEAGAVSLRTQRYVRNEPVKAMVIAAAAGALIAGLLAIGGSRRYWRDR
ncbi:MAG: hypothetical protein ABIN96_09825 [Rubrivivax sp.]